MKALKIQLASPRGFCAGVDRAIQIVEGALEKWGAPVYVRHEIVHNIHVVERLKSIGAVFVEELDECPNDRPVIFSAHGVPKSVPIDAQKRNMIYVDATCPLVSKVHIEAQRLYDLGYEIILIGHKGHPEVIGTLGQLKDGSITLIEDTNDAKNFMPKSTEKLGLITQTTLSVDDTIDIIKILEERFPKLHKPHKEDICYATTNRQESVKAASTNADLLLVVGSQTSSNSQRLREVGLKSGAKHSYLIDDVNDIDWAWFDDVNTLALSAGASAPEDLVLEIINACKARFNVSLDNRELIKENIVFKLPRILEA